MAYAPTVQAEAGFTHHSLRHYGTNLGAAQTDSLSHADCYAGLQGCARGARRRCISVTSPAGANTLTCRWPPP